MKVLAIRGENLASLAGRFDVDLTLAPLKGAGLFAITGPIGAGKSTLLDAVCLPLFNKTPRLGRIGGPLIGAPEEDERKRLPGNDVRSILRHGAGEGFAEVEFLATDGRAYRARWHVRRAKKRPDGTLQDVELSVHDIASGQAKAASNRAATLELLERLVGLKFEQFCRSVLLAQGDFAAFLKSDGGERGALLERMTGTEIYSEISRLAYEAAAQRKSELKLTENQLSSVKVLDDAARRELEARRGALESAEASLRLRQSNAEKERDWYQRLAELERSLEEASTARQKAEDAWNAAAGSRDELAAVEKAQPWRAQLRDADSAAAERGKAQSELTKCNEAEDGASRASLDATANTVNAAAALTAALETQQRCAPEIAQARELDLKAAGAEKETAAAHSASEATGKEACAAARHAAAVALQSDALQRDKDAAATWLGEHETSGRLANEWQFCKDQLEACRRATEQTAEAKVRLAALRKKHKQAAGALTKAVQAEKEAATEVRAAEEAAVAARELSDAKPLDAAREKRVRLAERLRRLDELCRIRAEALKLSAEEKQQRAEAKKLREHAAECDEQQALAGKALEHDNEALAEAEREAWLLTAALSHADVREKLKPGDACPVCGSTKHPWAKSGAPGEDKQAAQQRKLEELRKRRDVNLAAATAAQQRAEADRREAAKAETRADDCHGKTAEQTKLWRECRKGLDDAALPEELDDGADHAVVTLCAEGLALNQAAEAEEAKAQEFGGVLAKALAQHNEAQTAWAKSSQKRQEAENRANELTQQAQHVEESIAQFAADLAEKAGKVSHLFADRRAWQDELAEDAAAFIAVLAADVANWSKRERERAEADGQLAEIQPTLTAATSLAEAKAADCRAREQEWERRREHGEALKTERAGLLGGRATADVETELQRTVAAARTDKESADKRFAEAEQKLTQACAFRATAEAAAGRARAAEETATRALSEALATLGVDLVTLRARLGHDQEWIAEQRRKQEEVRKAKDAADTVVAERRRIREQHATTARPPTSRDEIETMLAALGDESRKLQGELGDVRTALGIDDKARADSQSLSAKRQEQQKGAELWCGIADLIGSADGKKFRSFAQSLTLSILLEHANHQLKALKPRYSVERVPHSDLDLQIVDHDMGDERRGINSLSGGETFLVSLALALALSSLAARNAPVDSLFIDEGFGTLDAESLQIAIDVLDALQASGRKVGVISHVQGMGDRIGVEVRVVPEGSGRSRVEVRRQ